MAAEFLAASAGSRGSANCTLRGAFAPGFSSVFGVVPFRTWLPSLVSCVVRVPAGREGGCGRTLTLLTPCSPGKLNYGVSLLRIRVLGNGGCLECGSALPPCPQRPRAVRGLRGAQHPRSTPRALCAPPGPGGRDGSARLNCICPREGRSQCRRRKACEIQSEITGRTVYLVS